MPNNSVTVNEIEEWNEYVFTSGSSDEQNSDEQNSDEQNSDEQASDSSDIDIVAHGNLWDLLRYIF